MAFTRFFAVAALVITCLLPGVGHAQDASKSFGVLPFAINGPDKYTYLSRGIQDMLISRLTWEKKFVHVGKDKVSEAVTEQPASDKQATAARAALGSDYLVWGSVTILGEECSVDVRTTGPDGKTFPSSAQTSIAKLIPTLEGISKKINATVFKRPSAEEVMKANAPAPKNRLNPALIHNQTNEAQEFYLNPAFRYAGSVDSPGRWRSPSMPYISTGMTVGDVDGDGLNEIIIIGDHTVYAYRLTEGQYKPLGEITPGGNTLELLKVNLLDLNRDGLQEIIVAANYDGEPRSLILNFTDGGFKVVDKNIKLYLNVVKLPPLYKPMLVGQKKGRQHVLGEHVYEIGKMGGEYKLTKRIPLPEEANAFNFAFLPTKQGRYKILVVGSEDHIIVFTPKLERQAMTMKQFAGSALGFEIPDTFSGFEATRDQFTNMYYIPLRMLVEDVDKDGTHEVLVNKNVSVAAQFFKRYRFFPNGEMHAMNWDGVGLSLAWKTRRIKGTVTDYGLADMNNDGLLEMYVCLNSYPGPSGISRRKTIIVSYTMDTTKLEAPVDKELD